MMGWHGLDACDTCWQLPGWAGPGLPGLLLPEEGGRVVVVVACSHDRPCGRTGRTVFATYFAVVIKAGLSGGRAVRARALPWCPVSGVGGRLAHLKSMVTSDGVLLVSGQSPPNSTTTPRTCRR